MSRYIDAEEFIEDIKIEYTNFMMDGLKGTPRRMALSAKDVVERINEIPTADVQEVKHGIWTTKRTLYHDGETYCSLCDYESEAKHKYCPSCGAKMDEEVK